MLAAALVFVAPLTLVPSHPHTLSPSSVPHRAAVKLMPPPLNPMERGLIERPLSVGIRAVDELTLCIHDLMANLNRTVGVPEDFEPKRKVHHWVTVLSTLGASDQISEDQARQIELDMQTSYQTYFAFLGHGQKKQGMQ